MGIKVAFVQPRFIVTLFLLIYAVLGTLVRYIDENFYYIGRDFKDIIHLGLISAFIFYVFFLFGDILAKKKNRPSLGVKKYISQKTNSSCFNQLINIGIIFQVIGYAFLLLWLTLRGGNLSLIRSAQTELASFDVTGGYQGFIVPFDMVIPGITLLYIANSRFRFGALVVYILCSLAIGFRYRIAVVLLAVLAVMIITGSGRSYSYIRLAIITIAGIAIISLASLTRVYTQGLDLSALSNFTNTWEVIQAILADTNIILGVSAVIEYCEEFDTFLHFSPLIYSFVMFVPRIMWPSKPEPESFDLIVNAIGTEQAVSAGTAIPIWGEMYISFGWFGIAIGSVLLGFFARRIFNRVFLPVNCECMAKLSLAVYATFFGFMYFVLSRGYLAQILPEFIVIVAPLVVLRSRFVMKKLHLCS